MKGNLVIYTGQLLLLGETYMVWIFWLEWGDAKNV